MRICSLFLLVIELARAVEASRVLVVGGSGRVGGSAVRALLKRGIEVDVGGRDPRNWGQYLDRMSEIDPGAALDKVRFQDIDLFNKESDLRSILAQYSLVVNTAGPFQGLSSPDLLEHCLNNRVKYVDVCDDINLARAARSPRFQTLARERDTSAIVSAGIWPGVSSILAQTLINRVARRGGDEVSKVRFSFFTAGSGGAGETILTATFLLLGEDVLTYVDGRPEYRKTATDSITRDFGIEIGLRECVRLNLIECESCWAHHKSRYPRLSVETRFGTAPRFWNKLFQAMALVLPQDLLKNREAMRALAIVSLPMVRLVDSFVGSTNGIQVEVEDTAGASFSALLTHRDLEQEVGCCLADFTMALLSGAADDGTHGVYFPEELPSDAARASILEASCNRSISFSMD